MKKGQAEMIGLTIIVIILFFSLILFIRMNSEKGTNDDVLIRSNVKANNLLNSIMTVTLKDDGRILRDAIENDCFKADDWCLGKQKVKGITQTGEIKWAECVKTDSNCGLDNCENGKKIRCMVRGCDGESECISNKWGDCNTKDVSCDICKCNDPNEPLCQLVKSTCKMGDEFDCITTGGERERKCNLMKDKIKDIINKINNQPYYLTFFYDNEIISLGLDCVDAVAASPVLYSDGFEANLKLCYS